MDGLAEGKRVFDLEIAALEKTRDSLDDTYLPEHSAADPAQALHRYLARLYKKDSFPLVRLL